MFCNVRFSSAQIIEGKDYSSRADVDHTFDMAGEDIFGQRFPSENFTYPDEVTGVKINALTTSRHSSSKMYQTHPQWTSDGEYIVFSSNRTARDGKGRQYYAVSMDNFEIVQITTGDDGSNFHLGWSSGNAYFVRNNNIIELDLHRLLGDSEVNSVGKPEDYEKLLAKVPDSIKPSGIGLDAKENRVFYSTRIDENTSAIYSTDLKSGETKKLKEVPFRIGHLQANPYVTGEVMYCWETGGDSPQRIWYLSIGDNGAVTNKPLFEESDSDWVTHEVFMGPDHILFNVMGHLDRLKKNKTGIFSLNLRTNELKYHGQTNGGGYWHSNATKDGKWIAGDTFDGKLYRINANDSTDVKLLTQGHRGLSKSPFTKEAHMHQSVSPNGKWVLINSSYFTDNDIMLVPLHPEISR
ncbi:biopolymer transporter Tol [Christiangramia fulva]|uniref:Biopolymer transporter Tol n=2 Tax=Christiangramia fulva TaxID=2126553 RepID=A0A2R3Z5X4_9FLAO|nr:biopolymer transporter Tol [Christiangramia fulva]